MSNRIAIIGWPGTGKTTLAKQLSDQLGIEARCTDEAMNLGWSEASEEVSHWFDKPGPWIVEGVAVPRALRKWHERNPDKPPPIDRFILLTNEPYQELVKGQTSMGKGMDTVLTQIMPWIADHVRIETW